MDNLKPKYNIVSTPGTTLGYKHTEESIKKMRNFVFSEEALARKKLTTINATVARSISVIVENVKNGEKFEYKSLTEAGNALKLSKSAISQALLKEKILKKTYLIKRKM